MVRFFFFFFFLEKIVRARAVRLSISGYTYIYFLSILFTTREFPLIIYIRDIFDLFVCLYARHTY